MQVKALDVLRVLLSMAFGLALILLVAAFAGVVVRQSGPMPGIGGF